MKTTKSVEQKLQETLDQYKVSKKLTVAMVKDWIWNDEGDSAMDASNRFQQKWTKYFPKIKDIDELNEVMQIFVDAWNYFPHKSLKGRSPDQMVQKSLRENPELRKEGNEQEMPDVIVGNRKMPWNSYAAMLKEMERVQAPFRKWVDEDILPAYEKFLSVTLSKKTVDKHMRIAEIFFDRAFHLGFVEFDEIRRDFIQKEFLKWWQTHVIMFSLSEKEILGSIKKLFKFISATYNKDVEKFGF